MATITNWTTATRDEGNAANNVTVTLPTVSGDGAVIAVAAVWRQASSFSVSDAVFSCDAAGSVNASPTDTKIGNVKACLFLIPVPTAGTQPTTATITASVTGDATGFWSVIAGELGPGLVDTTTPLSTVSALSAGTGTAGTFGEVAVPADAVWLGVVGRQRTSAVSFSDGPSKVTQLAHAHSDVSLRTSIVLADQLSTAGFTESNAAWSASDSRYGYVFAVALNPTGGSPPPAPTAAPTVASSSSSGTSANTINCPAPSGIQAGDLLVGFHRGRATADANAFSSPAGFTEIAGLSFRHSADPGNHDCAVAYRIADASDEVAATYPWTEDSTTNPDRHAVIMLRITGADPADPFGLSDHSNSDFTAPSVALDPSDLPALVLRLFGRQGDSVITVPGTEIATVAGLSGDANVARISAAYTTNVDPDTDTGTATATTAASSSEFAATLVVRPAPDATVVTPDPAVTGTSHPTTAGGTDGEATIGWDPDPEATSFRVELDSGAGFVTIVEDHGTTSYTFTGLAAGAYTAGVVAKSATVESSRGTAAFSLSDPIVGGSDLLAFDGSGDLVAYDLMFAADLP